LPRPELRRFGGRPNIVPLCREAHDPDGPVCGSGALQRLGDFDEAITLQAKERRVAACLPNEGLEPYRVSCLQRVQKLAPRAALGQHTNAARVGHVRVPLAFNPRARGHRGGDRFANTARVILGDPGREGHDILWEKRCGIQDVDDGLDFAGRGLQLAVRRDVSFGHS
jgi:hypothetical protein